MFQDFLDRATIQLDSDLYDRLRHYFEQYQLRLSIAETLSMGAISQYFAMMDTENRYMSTSFICPNAVSLIEYCHVPASVIKQDAYGLELAKAMAKGLNKQTKSSICISATGSLKREPNTDTLESTVHFAVYIQGSVHSKSVPINGNTQSFYKRLGLVAMQTLEGFLNRHFDNEGE